MADTLKDVIGTLKDTLVEVDKALGELNDPTIQDAIESDKRSFAFLQQCADKLLSDINDKKNRNAKTCLGESAAKFVHEGAASLAELGSGGQLGQQQSSEVISLAGQIADLAGDVDGLIIDIGRS